MKFIPFFGNPKDGSGESGHGRHLAFKAGGDEKGEPEIWQYKLYVFDCVSMQNKSNDCRPALHRSGSRIYFHTTIDQAKMCHPYGSSRARQSARTAPCAKQQISLIHSPAAHEFVLALFCFRPYMVHPHLLLALNRIHCHFV